MSFSRNMLAGSLLFLSCLSGSSAIPATQPAPKIYTIQIAQMKFQPAELKVKKGDKIIFINKDMVVHNLTEQIGKVRISPDIATGKSWSMVVTKEVNYFCSYHPVMKGKILIK